MMKRLIEAVKHLWSHEDDLKMKNIAHRYAERAWMDGHVVQKTGEIVPKESV